MNFKRIYKKYRQIINKTGGMCAYCGGDADQVDHINPRIKGGKNNEENLVCVCKRCNVIKNCHTLESFREKLFRHLNKIPHFTDIQKEWLLNKEFKMPDIDLVFYFEKMNIDIYSKGIK